MELSFVTAALRRRWWIILIFAELGLLPLIFGGTPVTTTFESVAQLEVLAPDDARTSGSPDRFVLNQVEVLQSRSIHEEVAARLAAPDRVDEVADQVADATEIAQAAETDIVSIIVRQNDPERAQNVAQTIADTYISRLVVAEVELRTPDIDSYEAELVILRTQLVAANEEIQAAMEPHIARIGEQNYSVPPVSSVAPQAESDKNFLTSEISRITQLKSSLENAPSSINTKIVQPATLPSTAVAESSRLIQGAFFVAMTLLGVTVALLWARFSPKVLDEVAAEEIIGVPVVTKVKKSRTLRQDPHVALTRLPQELISTVDQISVRAEAMAKIDQPLRLAVVGSQRGAGCTTLALAMAARFAAAEYSVVVVDTDRRDPWITDAYGADKHGGIPALLGSVADGVDRIYTRTSEPDVRVLGLGQKGTALRRESMPSLVSAASSAADIIIFDGGPLMDAASTVELCNTVDAVVLCVPLADQRSDDLVAVTRQLGESRGRVLPVITVPVRRAADRIVVPADPGADAAVQTTSVTPVPAPVTPPGPPVRRPSDRPPAKATEPEDRPAETAATVLTEPPPSRAEPDKNGSTGGGNVSKRESTARRTGSGRGRATDPKKKK